MFTIEYYEKEDGSLPAEDYILSVKDKKLKAKIFHDLEILELEGNQLRRPTSNHLEDGIFELRTIQSNNIARVLYFFYIDKKIILTNGFTKKTQKTPRKEIDLAKKYRDDYLTRFKE